MIEKSQKEGFIAGTPNYVKVINSLLSNQRHKGIPFSILYGTLYELDIQSQTSTEDESNLKGPLQTHNITIFQYDH